MNVWGNLWGDSWGTSWAEAEEASTAATPRRRSLLVRKVERVALSSKISRSALVMRKARR